MNDDVIEWKPTNMLEVRIEEPDDFLKIRETICHKHNFVSSCEVDIVWPF